MTNKFIIGLGCSWTQGEGGYPDHIWKQYNGRVQLRGVDDYHLRKYEHENSWVNVLSREYFPDHTPINLGSRGCGNRAAVHQLHFCDKVDFDNPNTTGIIVLMMSGFERFDYFQNTPFRTANQPDGYSNGEFVHYKWRTMWPHEGCDGTERPIWDAYAKLLWSEQFVAAEQLMALLDLQTFAKAHNFKVVVANAFNQRHEGIKEYFIQNAGVNLTCKFDWPNSYVHNTTPYTAFVQKLVELDGLIPSTHWHGFHQYYNKLSWPATYLTNCEGAHPTIEGYKVIAKELAGFISYRGYDR
jgi:hypothetical protein